MKHIKLFEEWSSGYSESNIINEDYLPTRNFIFQSVRDLRRNLESKSWFGPNHRIFKEPLIVSGKELGFRKLEKIILLYTYPYTSLGELRVKYGALDPRTGETYKTFQELKGKKIQAFMDKYEDNLIEYSRLNPKEKDNIVNKLDDFFTSESKRFNASHKGIQYELAQHYGFEEEENENDYFVIDDNDPPGWVLTWGDKCLRLDPEKKLIGYVEWDKPPIDAKPYNNIKDLVKTIDSMLKGDRAILR